MTKTRGCLLGPVDPQQILPKFKKDVPGNGSLVRPSARAGGPGSAAPREEKKGGYDIGLLHPPENFADTRSRFDSPENAHCKVPVTSPEQSFEIHSPGIIMTYRVSFEGSGGFPKGAHAPLLKLGG